MLARETDKWRYGHENGEQREKKEVKMREKTKTENSKTKKTIKK